MRNAQLKPNDVHTSISKNHHKHLGSATDAVCTKFLWLLPQLLHHIPLHINGQH